jgi:hypothetical protein
VTRLLKRCLLDGGTVDIEGLGVFRPDGNGAFAFSAESRPQVFLAYAVEDEAAVTRLYDDLKRHGFEPWLDSRKLMPGQNWPRAIDRAIDVSRYFIACLSTRCGSRRGYYHAEMRYAVQCARRVPLGEIFIIPVRLESCAVPTEIAREIQYVDLFPEWRKGVARVVSVMREQERKLRRRPIAA